MNKRTLVRIAMSLVVLIAFGFAGCGGGSDDSSTQPPQNPQNPQNPPQTPAPSITVLPAQFDFGTVTDVNSTAPLEVTIRNDGTADLVVSSIVLADTDNFVLDLNAGDAPCGSTTPSLADGERCTVEVDFLPQDTILPPEGVSYTAALTIQSNDPVTPTYDLALTGKRQDIAEIKVKINQLTACPRVVGTPVKAYVSVIDQAGFPVTTLGAADFTLTESGTVVGAPDDAAFVNDSVSLSVTLVMDYSDSITQEPDNVTDMEKAAINFIEQLSANDEAEIIKYATTIQVMQPFTSNKALLTTAIQTEPSVGAKTLFFDTLVRATTNITARTKDRKAIVIITDGEDNDGTGNPLSSNDIDNVIAYANREGLPVFTVGLGNRLDPAVLEQIADGTGGTYSPATTSDNLTTVYQQLAELLFSDQYMLTYNTALAGGVSGTLEVTAVDSAGNTGSDTKEIPICQ